MKLCYVVLLVLLSGYCCYKFDDKIPIYISALYNPIKSIKYHFFQLPLCYSRSVKFNDLTVLDIFHATYKAQTTYNILFKHNYTLFELCNYEMTKNNIKEKEVLIKVIETNMKFNFSYNSQSEILTNIGYVEELMRFPSITKIHVHSHFDFVFEYDDSEIKNAYIKENKAKDYTTIIPKDNDSYPIKINYSYSVLWVPFIDKTETKDIIQKANYKRKWLSVGNSLIFTILLFIIVLIVMKRSVNKDFLRYHNLPISKSFDGDNGWRTISSDVFRHPTRKILFCSIMGVGTQFFVIGLFIVLFWLSNGFVTNYHNSIDTTVMILYCLTSIIAGYISSGLYAIMKGSKWLLNLNLTSILFTFPCYFVLIFNNITHPTETPRYVLVFLSLLWILVSYPLLLLGGLLGRYKCKNIIIGKFAVNKIPRQIPYTKKCRTRFALTVIGGLITFSLLFTQVTEVINYMLQSKDYIHHNVFFIMVISFIISNMAAICISITFTYIQLNSEDYRWWWQSVWNCGFSFLNLILP
ncbi:Transmembrane 9 superfamily member 1 [Intoshia linei]|uniref:Transmembrane 9 superfamily member n=1 Tax=Intoshia linei TaxID=1819745 RepID=A0A177B6P4_9BILA|nr:Transmembrane 9 superfamily member 1 [Intoshia linei]